jgi:hypothetical protein
MRMKDLSIDLRPILVFADSTFKSFFRICDDFQ